jgi:hypothetical protein
LIANGTTENSSSVRAAPPGVAAGPFEFNSNHALGAKHWTTLFK